MKTEPQNKNPRGEYNLKRSAFIFKHAQLVYDMHKQGCSIQRIAEEISNLETRNVSRNLIYGFLKIIENDAERARLIMEGERIKSISQDLDKLTHITSEAIRWKPGVPPQVEKPKAGILTSDSKLVSQVAAPVATSVEPVAEKSKIKETEKNKDLISSLMKCAAPVKESDKEISKDPELAKLKITMLMSEYEGSTRAQIVNRYRSAGKNKYTVEEYKELVVTLMGSARGVPDYTQDQVDFLVKRSLELKK